MRAAGGSGYAVQQFPGRAGSLTTIDATTGAGEDSLGARWIDGDREDIRIVNHAAANGMPGHAAIRGLPRQMRSPGVKGLRIGGIEHESGDVLQLGILNGRNACPALVFAPPVNAMTRPYCDYVRIFGPKRERFYCKPGQGLLPVFAIVLGFPHACAGSVFTGDSSEVMMAVSRIDREGLHRS